MARLPISVLILTYNEEDIVEDCLKSVYGWTEEIFVVDSYSKDKTLDVVRKYTDKIYQHPFENYGAQRNWALENLPIRTEWIMNLDADQRVMGEMRDELIEIFSKGVGNEVKGFMMSTRAVFMGRWIRYGGHYPIYHHKIFRKGFGRCEARKYDQHFIVNGKVLKLKTDIIDIVTPDLTTLIEKLNRWTASEAEEDLSKRGESDQVRANFFGNPIERRRWLKVKVYYRLPLFLRPFLYFIYRYFIKRGFLDGTEGFIFHLTQGFFLRFLVDAKIYEYKKMNKK